MIAHTTTHERWTRRLALPLLVLQGLSGGVVSLAHASDRRSAPVHIEAAHDSACVALHDALRCALCQYAGSQVTAPRLRSVVPVSQTPVRRAPTRDAPPPHRCDRRTGQPRAPPPPRSSRRGGRSHPHAGRTRTPRTGVRGDPRRGILQDDSASVWWSIWAHGAVPDGCSGASPTARESAAGGLACGGGACAEGATR